MFLQGSVSQIIGVSKAFSDLAKFKRYSYISNPNVLLIIKANKRLMKEFTRNQVHFSIVGFDEKHKNGLVIPTNI